MTRKTDCKPAQRRIAEGNAAILRRFPFDDTRDLDDARRGFIGTADEPVIRDAAGRTVWDLEAYGFLAGDCPDEANPSLWRQSRLSADHGLFEVVEGIYQIRGFDLSNMTVVEGERGVLVIDPLISAETAAAALALYREHRGDRPVTGVLYTHSHVDHFGGVRGVVTDADIGGGVPVIAPRGFLEHAVSENVYAGTAMARRAAYMYGAALPTGERGQIGAGLGQTTSTGSVGLIPPTLDITRTGQTESVDGIRMVFQMTPGTEAPAELNIHFPDRSALCMAENATHNLHNLLTLRGAEVRDPREWARYLTEAVGLFGDSTDVAFASHHWPVWGRERAVEFLTEQRDVYAYLHDQTLRMLNRGHTPLEIAEMMEMPPALERAWHTHGYYGSVSHNTKAVYQRYMGWFDGNPAHLWEHPPVQSATRYVEFMGGADEVLRRARESFAAGDFRWVVQVVNHVVFADPDNAEARDLQADALEQLGYGSENGTWRNFYLTGALELRHGPVGTPTTTAAPDFMRALTLDQLFDALAIRVDGPRSWDADICVRWSVKDREPVTMRLRNGVLTHVTGIGPAAGEPDVEVTLDEDALRAVLLGEASVPGLVEQGRAKADGDLAKVDELLGHLGEPDPGFAIVTP
ncbi:MULTISPECIES: alkyl/aryl-sulfatase [unclassified Streptomyces]|uniref:alkyl/aryl-sulfatase n=1 Tax=unclassified Streptomyces TaxID=2593676 RepID=UPI000F5BBBBB|nr:MULTISPECIES: alkyl sulfatase dimerization domain-containing protein [unclassified Streptomyces]RPK60435.1 Metallo-beta-lactamase superfamily protein [Streptomyces sp. ADI95-17]WSG49031.1 MBL fold metallo-hydrolase [Streptomyces sp. NBC_01732]WSP50870.1 MBL fold metallo-hydrolase [Streptomyces sp. NBC_01243]WSW99684.1 MBL fold metallo-hydrolase [Streptomyces sp. NBC_00987]